MGGKKKQRSSAWPDIIDHEPPELRAHAASLLKTTQQWKQVADGGGLPPPEQFSRFLNAVTSLATRMRESEVFTELQRIRATLGEQDQKHTQMMQKMQHDIDRQASMATTTTSGRRGGPPSSYRDAVLSGHASPQPSLVSGWLARAQTNGTVPSNGISSPSSSAPAPVLPLREDLQIIVRGTDRTAVDPLRRDEQELVKRVNRTIQDLKDRMVSHRRISTGKVLPSGDVLLQADCLEDAERLTKNSGWCHVFGDKAGLKKPGYAVVMHGVPRRFDPYQPEAKTRIKMENAGRLADTPAEITHIGWLLSRRKMEEDQPETSKLVVEFDDAYAANQAILMGLALYGRNHDCQFFDGSQRLQQCFNCQLYGHIARNCKRSAQCAYCAESHDTPDCPRARDRAQAKCAACIKHEKKIKLSHFAFDKGCPVRAERLEIIRMNRINGPQWHHPMPWKSPSATTTANPTPSEASQTRLSGQRVSGRTSLNASTHASTGGLGSRKPTTQKRPRVAEADDDQIEEDIRAHHPNGTQPVSSLNDVNIEVANLAEDDPPASRTRSRRPTRTQTMITSDTLRTTGTDQSQTQLQPAQEDQ